MATDRNMRSKVSTLILMIWYLGLEPKLRSMGPCRGILGTLKSARRVSKRNV